MNNIKMDLKEIRSEDMKFIFLISHRFHSKVLVHIPWLTVR